MTEEITSLPGFHQMVLDALAEHVAVLRLDGAIVATNKAWDNFCCANGGDPAHWSVGANYHEVCWRASHVNGDPDAGRAHAGIHAVLLGERPSFSLEYPCHSPSEHRWFLLSVTPLCKSDNVVLGAVVSHLNITRRRQLEDDLETARRELAAGMMMVQTKLR